MTKGKMKVYVCAAALLAIAIAFGVFRYATQHRYSAAQRQQSGQQKFALQTIKELAPGDNGKTITVTEGTDLVISLGGNITTGYAWTVTSVTGSSVKQDGQVKYMDLPGTGLGRSGTFAVQFKSLAAGTSTVNMQYARHGQPARQTFSVTIKVTVKAQQLTATTAVGQVTHKIEFKAPYRKSVQLDVGDSIILFARFSGDPGLFDSVNYPTAKTTDGKAGDVLSTITAVTRLDKDNIQVQRYDAKRAGEAEIVIKHRSGKVVATIKVTVKAAASAPAEAAVTVDMTKPLPAQIDLIKGQIVLFDNTGEKATVKETDSKGALLEPVVSGCGLSKAFRALRDGSGEVTFESRNGAKRSIKVNVHPLTLGFDLTKSAPPKTIDLLKGQRVSFISKDIVDVTFSTTDKQSGDVLTKDKLAGHVLLAPGWVSFSCYQSERTGSGELTLTWYDSTGKQVRTTIITVRVK